MSTVIRYFAMHPTASNIFMVAIILLGLSLNRWRRRSTTR